jgi:hypothetical protein
MEWRRMSRNSVAAEVFLENERSSRKLLDGGKMHLCSRMLLPKM